MAFFRRGNTVRRAKAVNERNFDRSFVLFGKGSAGKSTLGNLLLGKKPKQFSEHKVPEAFGLTVKVHSGEAQIESGQVYDLNGSPNEILKIQVLDQPGINDQNFKFENHCEFMKKCIAVAKAEMTATFLILIDLQGSFFSSEELITMLNLAEILSDCNYSFFSNAIVVFTHADKLDPHMKRDTLKQILYEKVREEDFECIQELIDLVEERYIFINGEDKTDLNRFTILKNLFALTKPNLTVYINGNNGFRGNELKQLFREDEYTENFERNLLKQDVEYHFNPDLNLFKKHERRNLEEDISNALEKLSGITKGISAMVLLISLEEVFNKEIYNLILNLPETYNLGKEFKNDFWDYACILFKTPDDSEECVKRNVAHNVLLKALDLKVKSRYGWVTKRTSPEECSKRVTDLVRKVKLDSEGKTYTDRVVLAELNQTIRAAANLRRHKDLTKMTCKIGDEDICEDTPFYKMQYSPRVMVAHNEFVRDTDMISPRIGYFVLKNIDPTIADQFADKFPDKDVSIQTKVYKDFYLAAMKKK